MFGLVLAPLLEKNKGFRVTALTVDQCFTFKCFHVYGYLVRLIILFWD